ncbi:MAG: hypothetical protein KDD70_01105 [Bdellovibrionales bacterium]|nr:hypothetical protein [Bdellovibrionales bacterium]
MQHGELSADNSDMEFDRQEKGRNDREGATPQPSQIQELAALSDAIDRGELHKLIAFRSALIAQDLYVKEGYAQRVRDAVDNAPESSPEITSLPETLRYSPEFWAMDKKTQGEIARTLSRIARENAGLIGKCRELQESQLAMGEEGIVENTRHSFTPYSQPLDYLQALLENADIKHAAVFEDFFPGWKSHYCVTDLELDPRAVCQFSDYEFTIKNKGPNVTSVVFATECFLGKIVDEQRNKSFPKLEDPSLGNWAEFGYYTYSLDFRSHEVTARFVSYEESVELLRGARRGVNDEDLMSPSQAWLRIVSPEDRSLVMKSMLEKTNTGSDASHNFSGTDDAFRRVGTVLFAVLSRYAEALPDPPRLIANTLPKLEYGPVRAWQQMYREETLKSIIAKGHGWPLNPFDGSH